MAFWIAPAYFILIMSHLFPKLTFRPLPKQMLIKSEDRFEFMTNLFIGNIWPGQFNIVCFPFTKMLWSGDLPGLANQSIKTYPLYSCLLYFLDFNKLCSFSVLDFGMFEKSLSDERRWFTVLWLFGVWLFSKWRVFRPVFPKWRVLFTGLTKGQLQYLLHLHENFKLSVVPGNSSHVLPVGLTNWIQQGEWKNLLSIHKKLIPFPYLLPVINCLSTHSALHIVSQTCCTFCVN